MQTTVNVVCYKSKTLANGEHPLMIRLCQGRKLKYLSIGISILPQFWDFEKNKPRRNCPNKELITNLITEKTKEFSNQIIEFKSESKDFTVTKLVETVVGGNSIRTVCDFLNSEIERPYNEGRLKYASTFKELRTSLLEFNKHLDIYFSDVDINWLKQYEAFLRNKGLFDNSLGVRFRTLRAIYNKAIEQNIVYSYLEYLKSLNSKKRQSNVLLLKVMLNRILIIRLIENILN